MIRGKSISNRIGKCPKVSVIVPIYNSEAYLTECMDSIVNQTLKDIEIILVDDGSTDNSLEICKDFKKRDNRIHIYRQRNQGAGSARNLGMKHAKGEYLSFLDSDDFFELDMLEKLYKKASLSKADITFCDFCFYVNETKKKEICTWSIQRENIPQKSIFSIGDCPDTILNILAGEVWNCLYKRSFILDEGIYFLKIATYEDVFFSATALLTAKRIIFYDNIFINHRKHNSSLTTNCEKEWDSVFKAIFAVENFINIHGLMDMVIRSFIPFAFNLAKICISYREPIKGICLNYFRSKFISHFDLLTRNKKYLKQYQVKLMENILEKKNISPSLDEFYHKKRNKIVPIVLSACWDSDTITSVSLIQSIIQNSDCQYFYDVYVLHPSRSEYFWLNQLTTISTTNVRVSCIEIDTKCLEDFAENNEFYSLFIPEVLCGYNKVIYLNNKGILRKDISFLLKLNLSKYLIAAVKEQETSTYVEHNINAFSKDFISTDLMVLNLPLWRDKNVRKKFLEEFTLLSKKYKKPFRDHLNIVCLNSILCISNLQVSYWTSLFKDRSSLVPNHQDCDFFIYNDQLPVIDPSIELGYLWWTNIRQTPVYENVLFYCFLENQKKKQSNEPPIFNKNKIWT